MKFSFIRMLRPIGYSNILSTNQFTRSPSHAFTTQNKNNTIDTHLQTNNFKAIQCSKYIELFLWYTHKSYARSKPSLLILKRGRKKRIEKALQFWRKSHAFSKSIAFHYNIYNFKFNSSNLSRILYLHCAVQYIFLTRVSDVYECKFMLIWL